MPRPRLYECPIFSIDGKNASDNPRTAITESTEIHHLDVIKFTNLVIIPCSLLFYYSFEGAILENLLHLLDISM